MPAIRFNIGANASHLDFEDASDFHTLYGKVLSEASLCYEAAKSWVNG